MYGSKKQILKVDAYGRLTAQAVSKDTQGKTIE